MATVSTEYPIGMDPVELDRLDRQGRRLAPATRILFETAGIRPGMRVLDLGSGAGDVSLLVADLVGSTGEVIGIDRSADACARAALRARQRGLHNLRFLVGDIQDAAPVDHVDAVVCRLVLMYQADPAAVLRAQATRLRPGGLVVPVELDVSTARALPPTPLFGRAVGWLHTAMSRGSVQGTIGARLWAIAREAGLQPLGMLGVQPHFGPDDGQGMELFAGIVGALLPLIQRTGAATAEEVGIESLERRLSDEVRAADSVFAHPLLMSAWAGAKG